MTHHHIKTLDDGTRKYSNHTKYKPLSPQERKRAVRKPDDPRAVRFHGEWFLPLVVIPDDERSMPATRPDEEGIEHRTNCRCDVCKRPGVREWLSEQRRRRQAAR